MQVLMPLFLPRRAIVRTNRLHGRSLLLRVKSDGRSGSSLSGSFVSVHGNLASLKEGACVCVKRSAGNASTAATDVVSLIGENDAGRIHQKWPAGLAD